MIHLIFPQTFKALIMFSRLYCSSSSKVTPAKGTCCPPFQSHARPQSLPPRQTWGWSDAHTGQPPTLQCPLRKSPWKLGQALQSPQGNPPCGAVRACGGRTHHSRSPHNDHAPPAMKKGFAFIRFNSCCFFF